MVNYFHRLLSNDMLSPHGFCLLWRPELLWTHVISDGLIGVAYLTITLALALILRQRRDIPFGGLVWCFALFIMACGLTHFMSILTLWDPVYGLEALVKLVTAAASVVTAILLWRLIPLVVSLPSPSQLRYVNLELEQRIAERDLAIAELKCERDERVRAQETLLRTQKLDALGRLTGGVAHDFNNLLAALQGAFELIVRRASDPGRVRELAEEGLKVTDRGARLSAQLLTFSRSKQLTPEAFAIDELVSDLRDMLRRTLGPTIDLRFELGAPDQVVLADRTQLELALLNLAINARDATAADGQIVVATQIMSVKNEGADLCQGRYVQISVRDDGVGMSAEVSAQAFDPFFTTREMGRGTGLGLSQVYGFAKQLGGGARIESREGEGAKVSFWLPCADDPGHRADAKIGAPHPDDGIRAHVLVVDDDPAVRRIAVEALVMAGHRVREAGDGPTALALIATEAPDILLADYAMPGMTGAQLAAQVRAHAPAVKIVFATGYADIEGVQALLGPSQVILRKPYRFNELMARIAEALDAAPIAT
jgi:signal transduction histidine kinase/CheY-like chemotaxis protein